MTFGRLAVSDSELGVDVIDFDECYCYLFTVLYCSLDFARWSILDVVSGYMYSMFSLIRDFSFRFSLSCLAIVAGNRLWYILDWMFRDAREVYNGRTCGRSFSLTSVRLWRYVIVRVFLLV